MQMTPMEALFGWGGFIIGMATFFLAVLMNLQGKQFYVCCAFSLMVMTAGTSAPLWKRMDDLNARFEITAEDCADRGGTMQVAGGGMFSRDRTLCLFSDGATTTIHVPRKSE